MKKIFTLIAATVLAVSANAQDWTCGNIYLADGTTLVDNDYATVATANNTTSGTQIADEGGNPAPVTYFDKTFTHYLGVRVTDAPSAANPTGTAHETNVAIVVNAKKNTDMTLYYKVGATKSIDCYDQAAKEAVSIVQEASNPGDDYLFCKGVYKFQEGHTYTIYAKGGTIQLHALGFGEGTYVAPTAKYYANAAASTVDGFNTMVYGDGAKIALTGNATKTYSSASSITIGNSKYTSTKVSNGAQNTFYAPEGKKVYVLTIYSYVNKDAKTDRPCFWKEVGGTTYSLKDGTATEMESYKDGANPDVNKYVFAGGLSEITFTNTGEQACFVIEADYSPTGVASVATDNAAAAKAVKVAKNGSIVIVKDGAEYSVAGAQMK